MPREPAAERLPLPQHVWEYSFPERERNRYVSRSLGYVVLLNGAAALTLMAIVALNPESTSRRLSWAMLVFASEAMAGVRFLLMCVDSSRYRCQPTYSCGISCGFRP